MKTTTPDMTEVPTALPGVEGDELREKLLLDTAVEPEDASEEEEEIDPVETLPIRKPKRRWHVLRTLAGFGVFICVLVVTIAWFFGMGWFSGPKTQAVNRDKPQDASTSPATEDEKLKMALSMIAASATPPVAGPDANENIFPEEDSNAPKGDEHLRAGDSISSSFDIDQGKQTIPGENRAVPSPSLKKISAETKTQDISSGDPNIDRPLDKPKLREASGANHPDGARGRSLFFGLPNTTEKQVEIRNPKAPEPAVIEKTAAAAGPVRSGPNSKIPFGTLLPVRLLGSIYTLRNSGGFVRMELTRPVDGDGYAYPAGTMLVGNVRGGESARAFVSVTGLIDPVSGGLVRFTGELLGRDGGSGIEGRRRNLTSQWSRFFQGLKETASSVLGNLGAIRSGGSTVILSEPVRRGAESMTDDLSGAILKNDREDTFLEVAAGSNGYVLVTGLPEAGNE